MPKYEVELNDGRKFVVEADTQPLEQEILSFIGEQPQLDRTIGPVEGLIAGASGAVGRTIGAIAGGAKGASAGAATGLAIGGPVGAAVGGIGGAILGGIGGAFVGETAQKVVQDVVLPDDVNEKIWQWGQKAKDDAPIAYALGEIAPSLAVFKPSPKAVGEAITFARELAKNKDKLTVLLQNPANTAKVNNLINVGFGGLMEGGSSLVGEMTDDKEGINLMKVAATSAAGLLINDPYKHSKWLTGGSHNVDTQKTVAEAMESAEAKVRNLQAFAVDNTANLQVLGKEARELTLDQYSKTANSMEEAKVQMGELASLPNQIGKKYGVSPDKILEEAEQLSIDLSTLNRNKVLLARYEQQQKVIAETQSKAAKLEKEAVELAPNDPVKAVKIKQQADKLKANAAKLQSKNKLRTATGVSEADTLARIELAKQKPYFNELAEINAKAVEIGKKSMRMAVDEGIISQKDYDSITSSHDNWVSFQRYMEADELADMGIVVKNFRQGKSQPIKAQKGSDREVRNVLANTVRSHAQILRAIEQNNIAKQIAKNADDGGTGAGFMKVYDGVGKDGSPPKGLEGDPTVIKYKDGGKNKYLKIDTSGIAGQQVLRFFAGQNKAAIAGMTLAMSRLNRFLSNVLTKYNPAFPITNALRDMQDLLINHSANTNSLRRGIEAFKMLPKATKTMVDYALGRDTVDTKLFKEAMENGLAMGGVWSADRAEVAKTFEQLRKADANFLMRNLGKLAKNVEGFNQIVEMAPRMAAYMEAKSKGATAREAARLAREATVPFIRRGTGASQLGAWWLFYNASVQGVGRTLRSLSNPKVLAATTATLTTVATALHQYNKAVDEDYENKVYDWDKRHSFVIGLGTGDDGQFRYVSIPIAWGIKPVFNTANVMAKITAGDKVDLEAEANNISASFVQAYNPMAGSQSVGEALMPSAFQPFIDVYANRNWQGRDIRPDGFLRDVRTDDLPASHNYYDSLREDMLGRMGIRVSGELSKVGIETNPNDYKYLVEQYTGGVGKFIARLGTTVGSALQGKMPATRDIPIVSSLLKEREVANYEEAADGILPTVRVFNSISGKGAEIERIRRVREGGQIDTIAKEIRKLPLEQQGAALERLEAQGAPLANYVREKLEQTSTFMHKRVREIDNLPIKDGSRTRAIAFEAATLSPDDRQFFLSYLEEKKVISKEVRRQLFEAGLEW